MTTMLSTLLKTGRVAVVALSLGAAAMTAMPAQAASEPSLNFQLGIGNDGAVGGFSFGNKKKGFFPIKKCLTDRQVERGLEKYGFDDANVVKDLNGPRVAVVAEWNWRYYSMRVNKCTGEVSNIRRLKKGVDYFPGKPGYGKPGYGGGLGWQNDGFSFQFNFGN